MVQISLSYFCGTDLDQYSLWGCEYAFIPVYQFWTIFLGWTGLKFFGFKICIYYFWTIFLGWTGLKFFGLKICILYFVYFYENTYFYFYM